MSSINRCKCAVLVLAISCGCATVGGSNGSFWQAPGQMNQPGAQPLTNAPPASSAVDQQPSPPAPSGPQMVLPATGGAPALAQPLGGNLYLPVTGGPPVVGIPLSP
jgi:hypothetical protein